MLSRLEQSGRAHGVLPLNQHSTLRGDHAELSQRIHNVQQLPRLAPSVQQAWLNAERVSLQPQPAAELNVASADPQLGDKNVRYAQVEGELFGARGPRLSQIKQGGLGDCFFLAAVGSVVADDPAAIKNAIRENADGTYSVRFHRETLGMSFPVWVTVDGELPVDANGKLVYAKGSDSDDDGKLELWVPILEKAYAKFEDQFGPDDGVHGYADIGGGGRPRDALEALTGKDARYERAPLSDARLEDLLSAANGGVNVVVSTKDDRKQGWVGNHAYTVVGTYEQDGETMVTLKNPWGSREPNAADRGNKADDGLFSVSLAELSRNIKGVSTDERQPPSLLNFIKNIFG